jgi:hypothetical protein
MTRLLTRHSDVGCQPLQDSGASSARLRLVNAHRLDAVSFLRVGSLKEGSSVNAPFCYLLCFSYVIEDRGAHGDI